MDTSDGKPFDLVTLPVSQMGMAIAPFDKPQPVLRVQPLVHSRLRQAPAGYSGRSPGVTVPDGADAASAPAVDGSDARPDGAHAGADGEVWRPGRWPEWITAGWGHGDAGDMGNMPSRRHEHEPPDPAHVEHGMSSGKGYDFH